MRLIRLEVENYRAYVRGDVVMDPEGPTLIVGPNNAGKSTLVRAIADLRRPGGRCHRDKALPAIVQVTFRLDEAERLATASRIGAAGTESGHSLRRIAYRFVQSPGNNGFELRGISVANVTGQLAMAYATEETRRGVFRAWSRDLSALVVAEDPEAVPQRGGPNQSNILDSSGLLGEMCRGWIEGVFHFGPHRQGSTDRIDLRVRQDLDPAGSDYPQLVMDLVVNRPAMYRQVIGIMQQLIPEVSLQGRSEDTKAWVEFVDSAGVPRNIKDLGTGVEQLLMVVLASVAAPSVSTLLIEEPETGLHPGAQRRLAEYMTEWSETRQFIVTTHSTVFMDSAEHVPSAVNLVTRGEGASTVKRLRRPGTEALDALGVRLSDVLTAERIVVVEGSSDAAVIEEWFGPLLRGARAATVVAGGVDRAWCAPDLSEWLRQAQELPQPILLIRDRDELSSKQRGEALGTGVIFPLERRDLEAYFLDAGPVARALADWHAVDVSADVVEAKLAEAVDALRPLVVAKRVAAQLGASRLILRSDISTLEDAGDLSKNVVMALVRRRIADIPEVGALWDEVEQEIETAWPMRARELVPGARVLQRLYGGFGLEYSKITEGRRFASIVAAPHDLADRLAGFCSIATPGTDN